MKRLLVLVLLVPILALTMISCDADMRSNLAGFMGGFGGNVYEDAGLIVVNTAQAEAAAATVAAIGTGAGAETVVQDPLDTTKGKTSSMGVEVTVANGTTLLAPQSKDKQTELKNNLGDAFNSETQKKKLLEDLKKEATPEQKTAAEGTREVFNATLAALDDALNDASVTDPSSKQLGDALKKLALPPIGDKPTQADLLTLQLMTDLISNTVNALKDISGEDDLTKVNGTKLEANKTKVLSIIDDALFAAEVAEQISGAASIDFTGQIDLGSLMDGLGGDKGTRSSRESLPLTEAKDFIGTINALAPSIVELMGITYDSSLEEFTYEKAKYNSFLLNQQVYRSSMEQALKMMELGKLKKAEISSLAFDTSTLVKYALAVFITEHDAFWDEHKEAGALTPGEVIAAYLNATDTTDTTKTNKKLGLGKLTENDELILPEASDTGLDYEDWPGFLHAGSEKYPRNKAYYQAIISNIIRINDLGGIAQLSTELKKNFYDPDNPSTTDGLSDWYNDLDVIE